MEIDWRVLIYTALTAVGMLYGLFLLITHLDNTKFSADGICSFCGHQAGSHTPDFCGMCHSLYGQAHHGAAK